jgi:hypothetical protein
LRSIFVAFGEITDTAGEAPGNARRSPRPAGDFRSAVGGEVHIEEARSARNDFGEFVRRIKFETQREYRNDRAADLSEAAPCCRADERERARDQSAPNARPALADDEIEFAVFHSRIKNFLNGRIEAMNFIDEQNIVRLEIGEDARRDRRLSL